MTTDAKLKAVRREIAMRERVYPNRVANGRMTQFEADREIAVMRAIEQDYADRTERERNQLDLF